MSVNEYIGKYQISDDEYRKAKGLANSDALMMINNPSDIKWSEKAKRDNTKTQTADFGTALHCKVLEPNRFDDLIFVSSVKGRSTKKFEEEQKENKGKIVLTQEELNLINNMFDSIYSHPTANELLSAQGDCESSIFVNDSELDVLLKCRPDKDCFKKIKCLIDLKTTANIDDWRSDQKWINPLYKFNYGHQASYYLDICEQHYNMEADSFIFIAVEKNTTFGRHRVGVFQISKYELIELGFWGSHRNNIEEYKRCLEGDDWIHTESFKFISESSYEDDLEIEVVYEGDKDA